MLSTTFVKYRIKIHINVLNLGFLSETICYKILKIILV